jgi:hypothetical protein
MAMGIANQVVLDPYLADKFTVTRRAEVVNPANGRSATNDTVTPNVVGVVTMAEDESLLREQFPEYQYATRILSIITKFRMQTAVDGYQPDKVTWRGDDYIVIRIDPYPQYGGLYETICSSIGRADKSI